MLKTLLLLVIAGAALPAQTAIGVAKGSVERIKVHGKGLEGNLAGDSAERHVTVYLPPSYKTARGKRFPVVYMLHGFTDSDTKWFFDEKHWIHVGAVLDKAMSAPGAREFIVVMPNAYTAFWGSMYSNSAVTGDWENFVARELVAYIDSKYRTVAQTASRGLTGHSMGGYGAMRIGMKNPDVFSSVYLLSPCCMSYSVPRGGPAAAKAESIKSLSEVSDNDFFLKAQLASAAAWAPNPKNPPLYIDLMTRNGEPRPEIAAKMAANAPLAMIDQYITNIRRLKAISFDAGDKDRSIAATIKTLDKVLTDYSIPHGFEVYDGDHLNRIAERIETKVLPFFSVNLK